jgi:hypothetical protein
VLLGELLDGSYAIVSRSRCALAGRALDVP